MMMTMMMTTTATRILYCHVSEVETHCSSR